MRFEKNSWNKKVIGRNLKCSRKFSTSLWRKFENFKFFYHKNFFAFRFAEKKNQSEINLANVSNKVFLCKIVY